ncbi:pyridoxamine 5'-phosphate oxidase family protein [Streptomyces sp. ICN441]|uniref:Pyridoxamine 5'-phosphate oxidase n=1 Tax=Streptomyces tirandamycinicus TaxID=2174846 RepID=A0A2S1ST99_9ACTN|nr:MULTISPECIES: pyridoxamine 5'-phosphate oxidase family protein [Streptomyces]AWI29623.1 pyridoxamine 5'-phosphate oxidase [Streptomyces tirandamycinicus]TFE48124.1 pyridoxamine 5'-phosphate oxidase family protein [Streptomyces sp. ICN441]
MALSREEREQFLAEPHVAAIAIDSGEENRAPLSVPIWYQYEPGGDLWILTGRDSRKHRLIDAAGRFSLMVDRLEPTVRYVQVEGPVTSTEPGTEAALRELAGRYLPPDKVDGYVEFALKDHGETVVLRMRPQRWLSSDLGRV